MVSQAGELVTPASVAQRQLIALLALRAGDVVPMSSICSALELSRGAARTTISRVRRLVGPDVLVTESPGYALRAESDVDRFEQLVATARSASITDAIALRAEALDVFRWEALPEFAHEEWAMGAATRLNEIRANTVEDLAASLIAAGRRNEAIAALEPHVVAYPYRARPRELQMTALALDGRQSEALRVFQTYRRFLVDEAGTEPPASVRAVEVAIATDRLGPSDAARTWAAGNSHASRTLPEGTVTFMLTDIERSTEAWERDVDAMELAVKRHYEIIDQLVTRHGGMRPEEQGEGDSTVTVFVDADRAVVAALDIQLAFAQERWPPGTPIRIRIGLHTGEAQLRNDLNYAGLTVIRTARLRNLAQGGQVLVSAAMKAMLGTPLPPPISLRDLGRHEMKGLGGAEHIYQLEHPGLTADFPPSHALESTPTNVPASQTTFVGRIDELSVLDDLLARHRLVTVTGSGGAGKTRIANRTALDQLDRFPDGVWWFELASINENSAVPRLVAEVLRVRIDDGDDDSIIDAIFRRLGNDACLLIFDNAEHVVDGVAGVVADLLRQCPNLFIIVTSRRVLGVAGEFAWRLPSLSMPATAGSVDAAALMASDSVVLFVERALTAGASITLNDDDLPVVAEICRWLGGVPLAIELAAARTRVLAPRQILDGLTDALGLLTRGRRSALPRHQTLEGSIAWSVDLLSDDERSLLARLSIFVGSFDLDAVTAVCMTDATTAAAATALDLIEGLVDHSLVTPVGGSEARRLSLLEVVRQYGARMLNAAGETATMHERHARHFMDLSHRFGPVAETADELRAVRRLEADAGNIEAALVWYRDRGAPDQMAALAVDLAPYWNMIAASRDSERWLSFALAVTPAAPIQSRARMHAYRALTRSNVGDYRGSLDDCVAALDLAESVFDEWSIGRARWVISDMATWGNLETWRALSDQAIDALAASGDSFAEAYARVWRAMPYLMRGHLSVGTDALRAAVAKVAALDNPTVNGSLLAWRAWAAFHSGEFGRAEQFASEALAGPGFRLASQRFLVEMISIGAALHRGRNHPLRAEFERNTALAHRQGEVLTAASSRQYMVGWLLFSDPAAALDAAVRLLGDLPPTYKLGVCETNLAAAWACLALDDVEAARRHADAAAATGSVANWPIVRTRLMAVEAMISIARSELGEAIAVADAAVVLAESEGLRVALVDALETRALAAAAGDDFARFAEITGLVSTLRQRMEYADVFLPLSLPGAKATHRAMSAIGQGAFDAHRSRAALFTPRDVIGSAPPATSARHERAR